MAGVNGGQRCGITRRRRSGTTAGNDSGSGQHNGEHNPGVVLHLLNLPLFGCFIELGCFKARHGCGDNGEVQDSHASGPLKTGMGGLFRRA